MKNRIRALLGIKPPSAIDGDLTLDDLGVETDPGTAWHPDKPITDLTYEEVMEHLAKPERLEQPDAGLVLDHDAEDEGTD